jgi:DNA-binding transcriptional MerR regulator
MRSDETREFAKPHNSLRDCDINSAKFASAGRAAEFQSPVRVTCLTLPLQEAVRCRASATGTPFPVVGLAMFSIGEFSKLTKLTVKTLRFYHEQRLLAPVFVDPDTGYRYYDQNKLETAKAISFLRGLEFSVSDIRKLLDENADDDLLQMLERQQTAIKGRIDHLKEASVSLERFILEVKEDRAMAHTIDEVQEKTLEPVLVAGIRMQGKYSDCGQAFARIGRSLGRLICGKPLLLHYDSEYHESGADFEACLPVRQEKSVQGISVRTLPGGRCVALVHRGPYEQLGRSYARIFDVVNDLGKLCLGREAIIDRHESVAVIHKRIFEPLIDRSAVPHDERPPVNRHDHRPLGTFALRIDVCFDGQIADLLVGIGLHLFLAAIFVGRNNAGGRRHQAERTKGGRQSS